MSILGELNQTELLFYPTNIVSHFTLFRVAAGSPAVADVPFRSDLESTGDV
jgi:hypothetical protein